MSRRQSQLPPLLWYPTEAAEALDFVAYPGDGLPSPDDWIVRDPEGRPALLYWHQTNERGEEEVGACRPLDDGEQLEFSVTRIWGRAIMTIAPDGTWSVDRPPPPATTLFVPEGRHGCARSLERLAETQLGLHAEACRAPVSWLPGETAEAYATRKLALRRAITSIIRLEVTYIEDEEPQRLQYSAARQRFELFDE